MHEVAVGNGSGSGSSLVGSGSAAVVLQCNSRSVLLVCHRLATYMRQPTCPRHLQVVHLKLEDNALVYGCLAWWLSKTWWRVAQPLGGCMATAVPTALPEAPANELEPCNWAGGGGWGSAEAPWRTQTHPYWQGLPLGVGKRSSVPKAPAGVAPTTRRTRCHPWPPGLAPSVRRRLLVCIYLCWYKCVCAATCQAVDGQLWGVLHNHICCYHGKPGNPGDFFVTSSYSCSHLG